MIRLKLTATKGWVFLAAGIVAYEIVAPSNELLSHGVDRALEAHPVLTRAAIGLIAAHLLNLLDGPRLQYVDPIYYLALVGKAAGLRGGKVDVFEKSFEVELWAV